MKSLAPILRQRRHGRMAETAVGLARHAGEIVLSDGIADEGANHLDRHLGVGPAGKVWIALASSCGQDSGT